jgi:hypothetical protein
MVDQESRSRITPAASQTRALPRIARVGLATIVFGLIFDLSEHSFGPPAASAVSGFSAGEHAAHLVILIGMVLVLAGVIADGSHAASRQDRQKRSPRDAIR